MFLLIAEKCTEILHDAPAATPAPQVLVSLHTPVLESLMLVIVSAAAPVLVSTAVALRAYLCMYSRLGTRLTVPRVSVMLTVADRVGSVTDVAVRLTVASVGSACGAVYVVVVLSF